MSMLRDAQGAMRTWVKTVMGGLIGIFGGAVMTWATFVVDKVIKPARPVPNYSTEVNGLTVTFNNLSQGGKEATWDFGDGSPLEFLPADHKTVTHTYKKPGNYTAKLALSNSFDQEQDRSVTIEVGGPQTAGGTVNKPALLDLKAQAPGVPGQPVYAPATFQFEAAVQNAQFLVWDFGDGRGMTPGDPKEMRTFDRPGTYTVKVCVFNGKEKSEKEVRLAVMEPPRNNVTIELQVTDSGSKTVQREESATQRRQILQGAAGVIERTIQAKPGFQIVSVENKKSNSQNVKNIKWEIGPNKGGVRVYGQMSGKPGEPATLSEHFVITEEKKGDAVLTQTKLVGVVPAPGQVSLTLPGLSPDMAKVQRKFGAAVKQQDRTLWQGQQLPSRVPVQVGGQTFTLTATQNGDRIDVQVQ